MNTIINYFVRLQPDVSEVSYVAVNVRYAEGRRLHGCLKRHMTVVYRWQ
jgi:hypothetical protein